MKTNNPKIQETLNYLNKKEFEAFRVEHRKAHLCEVGNGEKKEMEINKAIGIVFDKIERIEIAVEPLFDFAVFHKIAMKYKLYWLFGFLVGVFFSHNVWQPILLKMLG